MKIVELIRLEEGKDGTIGALKIDKEVFCWTLEPADKLNKPNESCIPIQQYICQKITSPKFGITFKVFDVPGRSNILFHKGNTKDDTLGCIILGSRVSNLKEKRAVLNSGETFNFFMKKIFPDFVFHLTIKTEY